MLFRLPLGELFRRNLGLRIERAELAFPPLPVAMHGHVAGNIAAHDAPRE